MAALKIAARKVGTTGAKCCCDPEVILECKSRTATAQLVGFWPINGDWSDMRRWRRSTLSGEITGQEANLFSDCPSPAITVPLSADKTCTPSVCRRRAVGSYYPFSSSTKVGQYSATTGAYSQTGSSYYYNPGGTPITDTLGPNTYHSLRCPSGLSGSTIASTLEFSPDSATVATTPSCFRYAQGTYWHHLGALRADHDDQDTETDAELRVTAAWSAWKCGGAATCCIAFRGAKRVVNQADKPVVWDMRSAKFRVGITDGVEGDLYQVAVDYERRLIGATEWVLVATDYFSVVSAPDPVVSPIVDPVVAHDAWPEYDVPQLTGYETRVTNQRIYHP